MAGEILMLCGDGLKVLTFDILAGHFSAEQAVFATEDELTLVEDPGDESDWEDIGDNEVDDNQHRFSHIPKTNAMDCPFILIVDTSGIHHLPLLMCPCQGSEKNIAEALASGLLPSTFKDIRTTFTTRCLDDFHLANLECKTSAYQFYQLLKRRTNPANPMAVPNRYAEFRRASREWRHLKKMKLHGFGHSDHQPGVGDLAIFCPACPQPGINLPQDCNTADDRSVCTLLAMHRANKWISVLYTRSFVTDGNFSADHLKQKHPEDDVWLLRGEGMMTGTHRYSEHLKVAIEKYTVRVTSCIGHRRD